VFGSKKRLEEKLRASGKHAPAEVLEADSSYGITRGNPAFVGATNIVWKLKLQVRPEGEPEFTADVKAEFPQLSSPAKGMTLNVLYDPDDHSKVVVDQSPQGGIVTAIENMVSKSPAVQANPALGGALENLMHDALADPAGFRERMHEQAAAGINPLAGAFGAPTAPESPVDELTKLADLRDRGALTPEEFEAQKKKILGES
jgi:hypothetical protein